MLNHVACGIPPVIKKLAPENVSPDAPNRRVPLTLQPLMAKALRVKVMDLETAVVNMGRGVRRQENSMVISIRLAEVNVREDGDMLPRALGPMVDIQDIRRHNVEGARVPAHLRLKVAHTQAVVAELMHRRRARLEALEARNPRLVRLVVCRQYLRVGAWLLLLLPVHQVHSEALWVVQRDEVSAARRVVERLNGRGARQRARLLQLGVARHLEAAAEERARSLLRVVDVGVVAVAVEPHFGGGAGGDAHAKVAQEGGDLRQVWVLVAHVDELCELDLRG